MTARQLLNAMVSVYVSGCNVGQPHTDHRGGMAEMMIRAAMVAYDESYDHATERVGDMVADLLISRD